MTIKIKKGSKVSESQKRIEALEAKRQKRKIRLKKQILSETFGSVQFGESKTALEIQKEMRDEWQKNSITVLCSALALNYVALYR